MRKKAGYTLAEALVSMLIISVVGITAMGFVSGYLKMTFARDKQNITVISGINTIEKLKAEVHTLPQLYNFSKEHEIKIVAVGLGEISFTSDTTYTVVSNENYGFSDKLISDKPKLFRIEVGSDIPNTKLTAIIRLE